MGRGHHCPDGWFSIKFPTSRVDFSTYSSQRSSENFSENFCVMSFNHSQWTSLPQCLLVGSWFPDCDSIVPWDGRSSCLLVGSWFPDCDSIVPWDGRSSCCLASSTASTTRLHDGSWGLLMVFVLPLLIHIAHFFRCNIKYEYR